MFVLKIKIQTNGTVDRYKARIVVLGCNQDEEQFDKLYSPVLDFTTVRLALTIAGIEGSYIHQMDVKVHTYTVSPQRMFICPRRLILKTAITLIMFLSCTGVCMG